MSEIRLKKQSGAETPPTGYASQFVNSDGNLALKLEDGTTKVFTQISEIDGGSPATGIVPIKIRRGAADAWTSANPVLANGEFGLETDTNKIKIGDGVHAWEDLSYITGTVDLSNVQIQMRRDTATNWGSANPILAAGEIGIDLTDMSFRIGNGTSHWEDLPKWTHETPGTVASPTGFSVDAGSSIILHPGTSDGADTYNAYRTDDGTTPTKTNGTKLTGVTDNQADTGLTDGVLYKYAFTAIAGGIESDVTTPVSALQYTPNGKKLYFNGGDTEVIIDQAVVDPGIGGAFSFIVTIAPSAAHYHSTLWKGGPTGGMSDASLGFQINPDGSVTLYLISGGYEPMSSALPIFEMDGTPHTICVTWDGTTDVPENVKLYADGVLTDTFTKTTGMIQSPAWPLRIGCLGPPNHYNDTEGYVQEVALYSRELLLAETTAVIADDAHLIVYYKLNEGVGTWAVDSKNKGIFSEIMDGTWT